MRDRHDKPWRARTAMSMMASEVVNAMAGGSTPMLSILDNTGASACASTMRRDSRVIVSDDCLRCRSARSADDGRRWNSDSDTPLSSMLSEELVEESDELSNVLPVGLSASTSRDWSESAGCDCSAPLVALVLMLCTCGVDVPRRCEGDDDDDDDEDDADEFGEANANVSRFLLLLLPPPRYLERRWRPRWLLRGDTAGTEPEAPASGTASVDDDDDDDDDDGLLRLRETSPPPPPPPEVDAKKLSRSMAGEGSERVIEIESERVRERVSHLHRCRTTSPSSSSSSSWGRRRLPRTALVLPRVLLVTRRWPMSHLQ